MDYRGPFGAIDKRVEVGLFQCDRPDLDGANQKRFAMVMRTGTDRTFSKATRERPERKKPTTARTWASCFIRGRPCGIRTCDQRIKSPLLYQLS